MKRILFLILVLLLSACSGSNQTEQDLLFECYGTQRDDNTVLEEYYLLTVDGADKDTIKQMTSLVNYFYRFQITDQNNEEYLNQQLLSYSDLEGVTYSHNIGSFGSQEKLDLDYTIADMTQLLERGLITSSTDQAPTAISFEVTKQTLPESVSCRAHSETEPTFESDLIGTSNLSTDMNVVNDKLFESEVVVEEGRDLVMRCTYTDTDFPDLNTYHEFTYEENTDIVMMQRNHDESSIAYGYTIASVTDQANKQKAEYSGIHGVTFEYEIDEENDIYKTDFTVDYFQVNLQDLVDAGLLMPFENATHISLQQTLLNYTDDWVCEPVE